ncbi:slr1658 superfamily regulator [Leptolyngbya sp. PCC 6406]|uniref:slr1658 superfamily regulator n=1 Tax=Leptolyngbya sp. PCC 6406 TaxID=1173264 RepID=UPI0002ABC6A7|nr:hypothetical protein [Leptolyngbya sp. PCC 6406]
MKMIQSTEIETYGEFVAPTTDSAEYLTIQFSPNFSPRQRRWRNYGLSADFLGDYFANFFPGTELTDSSINQRDTVKAAISYIANELLENAIKYADASIPEPIIVTLYLEEEKIVFNVKNHARTNIAENYKTFIETLLAAEDIETLYTAHLEKAALGGGESHMGILTMISDYGARFAWRFHPKAEDPNTVMVEVLVYLGM